MKRISKDWNTVWKMILTFHRFSIDETHSRFMKTFLTNLQIKGVYFNDSYFVEENEEYSSESMMINIRVQVMEKEYKLLYHTFHDSHDVYDPDFFIIEYHNGNEVTFTIEDFFERNKAFSYTNIFYDCIFRLFEEIEHEFNSEHREWEIAQHKKENHRMYGKNKMKKKYK